MTIQGLMQCMTNAIQPVEPVVLEHRVVLRGGGGADDDFGEGTSEGAVYDVSFETVSTYEREAADKDMGLMNAAKLVDCSAEVQQYDRQINMLLPRIANHREQRALLLSFAEAPANFLRAAVLEQHRQLRQNDDGYKLADMQERCEFYQLPWLEDACARMVQVNEVKRGVVRCLLYTSPSPRDKRQSRMPSSA